jgi:hypothetical protein
LRRHRGERGASCHSSSPWLLLASTTRAMCLPVEWRGSAATDDLSWPDVPPAQTLAIAARVIQDNQEGQHVPINELEAPNLSTLVELVVGLRGALPNDRFLWYRGIDSDRHALLPKLLRDNKSSDAVFERETRLVTRFRQRGYAYWPAGYPQDDWEHLFAMQHYGIPTRLLDWTENLFVAVYFALSSAPSAKQKKNAPVEHPVVWVIDPVQWNRSMPGLSEFGSSIQVLTTVDEHADPYRPTTNKKRPKSPVAIYGTHNSARIVVQRGTFIVWGSETAPLEQVATGDITKIRLTGTRDEMRQDLRFLGFSETMVYPELTSLASELSRAEGWRV